MQCIKGYIQIKIKIVQQKKEVKLKLNSNYQNSFHMIKKSS